MDSIRWMAVAAILGLCTAYAMWGGGTSPSPPTPLPQVERGAGAPPAQVKKEPTLPVKAAPAKAASALKFTPDALDFGTVLVNESKALDVAVENSGAQTVTIFEIKGSCGCLKAELPQGVRSIAPGKSEKLHVVFTGLPGKREENYTVTLATDEPGRPRPAFAVRGKVEQVFILEPLVLYFGELPRKTPKTMEAVIRHVENKPFAIQSVSAKNADFSFRWEPLAVPPLPLGEGGVRAGVASSYKIIATFSGSKPGPILDVADIFTDHPRMKILPLHLSARVIGDVVANPRLLIVRQDARKPLGAFETVLKRLTPGPLEIEKASEAEGLPVEFTAEPAGEGAVKLSIRFKGEFKRAMPSGEFLVKTSVEPEPLRLPFSIIRQGPQIQLAPQIPKKQP